MHPHALLDLASELLRSVLKFDAPADGLVSMFFRKHAKLGARERHTLAETAYTLLRQRLLFQHLAQSGNGPLERRLAVGVLVVVIVVLNAWLIWPQTRC